MTAQEARELSAKDIHYDDKLKFIMECIQTVAEQGRYSTIISGFDVTRNCLITLQALGYTIEYISEGDVDISWE